MVLLAADQWGTPHFRIALAGYAPPLLPKGHTQSSVRLAFQNQTQSRIENPVLHRSLTTGSASFIFMPFGAPKGHTKHDLHDVEACIVIAILNSSRRYPLKIFFPAVLQLP
jgi:hypothetical protein